MATVIIIKLYLRQSDLEKFILIVNISRTISKESITNHLSYHEPLLVFCQGFLLTKRYLFFKSKLLFIHPQGFCSGKDFFYCVFVLSTYAHLLIRESVNQNTCCCCLSWLTLLWTPQPCCGVQFKAIFTMLCLGKKTLMTVNFCC